MQQQLGEKIGIGRTADVFEYTTDTIIKLFKIEFPSNLVQLEIERHTFVQGCGLPVPRLFDSIIVDGRKGLIYQRIDGVSMLRSMMKKPNKIISFAHDMGALHNDIGTCLIDTDMPSNKEGLINHIKKQELLNEDEKQQILAYLECLPEKEQLCHGDFHPDNILVANNKYWIIDWMTASKGSFSADVMRTHMMLNYSSAPDITPFFHLITRIFGSVFEKTYNKSLLKFGRINFEDILAWEMPVLAARLIEGIPTVEKNMIVRRLRELI